MMLVHGVLTNFIHKLNSVGKGKMNNKASGATIPYHLRPHKAIERNLFLKILKMLDRIPNVDLKNYRYVGFGAAFLEDFKILHSEFGITNMHSIEMDECAYSRQEFNNPYSFVKLFPLSSTDYITGGSFKYDKQQIIWLDYASKDYAQQFKDLESLAEKTEELDILKFTFSSQLPQNPNFPKILAKFKEDDSLKDYLPNWVKVSDIATRYATVIRSMAFKALERGFSKARKDLTYNNLAAFTYADGLMMTTMTGIVTRKKSINEYLNYSGLKKWPFVSLSDHDNFVIEGHDIKVPIMTITERIEIDRKLKKFSAKRLANSIRFKYGDDNDTPDYHEQLIEGYTKYYTYLPYYSKVTY
jgi:hypothetical protein